MLQEADRLARAAGVANVEWRQATPRRCRLTWARSGWSPLPSPSIGWTSIGWPRAVHGMLTPDGASVHVHATTHRGMEPTTSSFAVSAVPGAGRGWSRRSVRRRHAWWTRPERGVRGLPRRRVPRADLDHRLAAGRHMVDRPGHRRPLSLPTRLRTCSATGWRGSSTRLAPCCSQRARRGSSNSAKLPPTSGGGQDLRPVTAAPSDLQRLAGLLVRPARRWSSVHHDGPDRELPTSTEADVAAAERARAAQPVGPRNLKDGPTCCSASMTSCWTAG